MNDSWIQSILVPAAMFSLMFGMGLTLRVTDFRRIAAKPAATMIGTLLQLVGLPLIGIALALAFELQPLLAAGLVIVAACPGGMFSNMYVHFAGGNTALSVTLTASATMATLFTLPLWVNGTLSYVGGGTDVQMPVLRTALELGGLTVLPILIGMGFRSRRPEAMAFERWLTPGAAIVIVGAMVSEGLQRPELPTAAARQSALPVILFSLITIATGLIVPALARLPIRDTVTIAVELIVKNTLLGIVLAMRSLDFDAMIPIVVFSMIQTPAGLLILVVWRLLARFGWVEPPDAIAQA